MAILRAFKHQKFLLIWLGQTISRVGDFIYEIALAWWVLEKTGSAQSMSLVLIFAISPSVLFSLIGGVVVDRLPRLRVMFASDVLRGGLALAISVLALTNRMEIWHVFLASLFFGFLTPSSNQPTPPWCPNLSPQPTWPPPMH